MTRAKAMIYGLILLVLAGAWWFFQKDGDLVLAQWQNQPDLDLSEALTQGLQEQQTRIYLRQYGLTGEDFSEVWNDLLCAHPELFFVDNEYEYVTLGDRVMYVVPRYTLTGDALSEAQVAYDLAIQDIVDAVESDWTDLEKALYLHDYMVTHYVYDEDLTYYDAYHMLTEQTGVCQAYTLTYQALLRAVDVECGYVLSDEMNHSWNVVNIDGHWYNVDVTYDDPTFDRLGKVQHPYFLVSDKKIALDHAGGTRADPCTSTAYDDAVWTQVSTAFVPLDGNFYCIENGQLCRWENEELIPLYTIDDLWFVEGKSDTYWEGCYASLDTDGTHLLFSTPHSVQQYDVQSGQVQTVYSYDGEGSIYGFVANQDGSVTCQISQSPNEPGFLARITNS